ncbi:MAG: hypothetical protein A2293_12430 [Elusimicrobia bacterium RIFOXYB2_FULL_49_7]|nr:MAG: hypothetical protein A2293_12430 [Elusimicrobia bacterium RIFOXYB2_FULL_49_7]
MNDYIRYRYHVAHFDADVVSTDLFEMGCLGITELSQTWFEAFFPNQPEIRVTTEDYFNTHARPYEACAVQDEDWMAAFRTHVKPVCLTPHITVHPDPSTLPTSLLPGHVTLVIPPKMSFGTGHHETTRLCAQLIEAYALHCTSLLDVGTGTGLLALVARQSGITEVLALDNDPTILDNVAENIAQNDKNVFSFFIGTLSNLTQDKRWDMVAANLISSVIYEWLPSLLVHARRYLLFSGILTSEQALFREKMIAAGLTPLCEKTENEWYAGLYTK